MLPGEDKKRSAVDDVICLDDSPLPPAKSQDFESFKDKVADKAMEATSNC